MFRLSKITDYGIVLLAHLAKNREATTQNAREVAAAVDLPLPVVSKILKSLARRGVVESHRGSKGGYALRQAPGEITVTDMVEALDGPVALTQCNLGPHVCEHDGSCAVRDPWHVINRVVEVALSKITLADLIDPRFTTGETPLSILGRQSSSPVAPSLGTRAPTVPLD
ncbi:MAG: SUF system Fe-S cluster assembly regulator [Myxococcota bacterium]